MKFDVYPIKEDRYGFQYAKNTILKTQNEQACMHCGEQTNFVDVISEGHLCSDECESAWYEEFVSLINES